MQRENLKILEDKVLDWRASCTGQRILDRSESVGLESVLDLRERELEQAESFALERQPRTRQGVLDWKGKEIWTRQKVLVWRELGRELWIGEGLGLETET